MLTKWESLDMPDNLKQAILSMSKERYAIIICTNVNFS